MTLKRYLILMSLATLLCWASFFIIIFSVNPFNTALLGFVFFYSSLFFSVLGTVSLVGFLLRHLFNKSQFISQQVIVSFRQSIWLSLIMIIGLYLQSQKLTTWWNLLILIFLMILLEFYFVYQNNDEQNQKQDN